MASDVLPGIGVGRGIAIGPLAMVNPAPGAPASEAPASPQDVERLQAAFTTVSARLSARATGASPALADVLRATALMAADPTLIKDAVALANSGKGPCAAVSEAVARIAAMFAAAGGYLAERVTDLNSVRDRVIAELLGVPEPGLALSERAIVAAVDLSPADTAALDLDLVAGIVTEQGGPTGHTAIIASQLGIPCIVRCEGISGVKPGTLVALDAGTGRVIVEPDPDTVESLERRAERAAALLADAAPGGTACGHAVALLANIGAPDDIPRALAAHAEGVGLFRTEVLFLSATEAPSQELQRGLYTEALAALEGRKLVVRTLDAGADKPLAFATLAHEENPALGVRGYRLIRTLPDLIADQVSALGALATDELWVMAPMISTPAEARAFASAARSAGVTRVGVMVEVPAAALRAEAILDEVDFVSLGTNDLAQYTMAADRLCGDLADLLSAWQPAVLDLIARTARAGAARSKPVGVCGESAADPLMALVLAGLGVTSLSMAPSALPGVRAALRGHRLERCRAIAAECLAQSSAEDARAAALAAANPEVLSAIGV